MLVAVLLAACWTLDTIQAVAPGVCWKTVLLPSRSRSSYCDCELL